MRRDLCVEVKNKIHIAGGSIMSTKRRIRRIIILGVLVLLVFAIIKGITSNKDKITEQQISYTEFLQMIDTDTIDTIEIQEGSTQVTAIDEEKPDIRYLSKVPNMEVLTEYVQGKILEGSEISFTVKETEQSASSIISNIFSFVLLLWPILLIFMMINSFKRMKNTMKNSPLNSESFANVFGGGEKHFEKATKSNVTFKDIRGLDEEINEVAEIVDFIKNPEKYRALGAKVPKGVLLDGAPGTGKTLLAKAIAGEADISFIATSGSSFVEKYVGVGASRVRALFEEARKNAPCIIFIDEIDAVGAKRDDGGGYSEHNQTLEQLLAEMDGFTERTNIVVIAATNRLSSLDPALIRPGRFDRKITVHLPDRKGREEILKLHGANKPFDETVRFDKVAYNTAGFSGASLENLLNEAALVAARKSKKAISDEDINEAMMKIQVGLKKSGRVISEKERRLTAVHEAGHAIVSLFLETQANLKEVCIIPRGSAGGYTLHDTVEDKNYISKTELNERLVCLLGGKAAEAVVLGDISTGPSNDLKVATETAREMIIYYGMDDEIGPISFAGASSTELGIFGTETMSVIGNKIAEMVKKAENDAKDLITKHRELLDQLVARLLEQETVSGEEIEAMFKAYQK